MRIRAVVAAVFALVVAGSAHALPGAEGPPQPKLKTVVVGIQGRRGVDPELARALADIVQGQLSTDPARTVLGRSDIMQAMSFEAEKQSVGCTDNSCLAEVAQAMNADRIVNGTMDKVGSVFLFVLSELDAKKLEIKARVEAQLPIDEERLIEAVRSATNDLLARSRGTGGATVATGGAGGALVIGPMKVTTTVVIDGTEQGNAPLTVNQIPAGSHSVELHPSGMAPIALNVAVFANDRTLIDVDLAHEKAPAPEAKKEYDDAMLGIGVKALCGCALCLGGLGTGIPGLVIGTTGGGQLSDPLPLGLSLGGGAGTLASIGVLGWAFAEAAGSPDEPVTEHVHAIKITPPPAQGEPVLLEVPAGEVKADAPMAN